MRFWVICLVPCSCSHRLVVAEGRAPQHQRQRPHQHLHLLLRHLRFRHVRLTTFQRSVSKTLRVTSLEQFCGTVRSSQPLDLVKPVPHLLYRPVWPTNFGGRSRTATIPSGAFACPSSNPIPTRCGMHVYSCAFGQ